MCQDLPSEDTRVTLVRTIKVRGVTVRRGATGVVAKKFLKKREVMVYFEGYGVRAQLAEADVGVPPGTRRKWRSRHG